MKRIWPYQALYYLFIPVVFFIYLKLCSAVFLSGGSSLGKVVAVVNCVLFIGTPVLILFLMRFSLLKWYFDPIAAAEIPFFFCMGMIIKQMNRGSSLVSSLSLVRAELLDDGGEGLWFLLGIFCFGVLSSFSLKRKAEESIAYRIVNKTKSLIYTARRNINT